MNLPPPPRRLDVAKVKGVTVVSFRDERIVEEVVIQEVGDQLLSLVEDGGHRYLLLNFGTVHALSSAALARLFSLRLKVKSIKGKLKFCCVHPELMDDFNLHTPLQAKLSEPLFEIFPEEEAPLTVDLPGPDGRGTVYVRPHDLDITRTRNGRPAWAARIMRLVPLGGLVRLDLALLDGTVLNVQLTRDRCLELNLSHGEDVFVTPKDMKYFTGSQNFIGDYVI